MLELAPCNLTFCNYLNFLIFSFTYGILPKHRRAALKRGTSNIIAFKFPRAFPFENSSSTQNKNSS